MSEPEDLSGNLVVQLGVVTEEPEPPLVRSQYRCRSLRMCRSMFDILACVGWRTLDGRIEPGGAVFEAKFMLPWSFSEEAAAEKYMPQLQHNMWVVAARTAVLSVITGGGKWVEIEGPCRSPLPTPYRHGRTQVLALCRKRRDPYPFRCRSSEAPDRGSPYRRHDLVECLGGVCHHLCPNAASLSRA